MKRNLLLLKITFTVLFLNNIVIHAQQDTIVVESLATDKDDYYKLKYETLDMFLRDESRLFKFAVSPFKPNEKYDFSIILSQLAYESKLAKNWSVVAEMNQEFMLLKDGVVFINSFDPGVRNYFFKTRQIEKGISGNNCNGVYAGIKASNLLRATKTIIDSSNDTYVGFYIIPELNLGIQQRISNLFYVDANAFVNYNTATNKPGFGLKVLIGLAINAGE